MKNKIIISIQPKYIEKIFSREKRYEYRKSFPEGVKVMFLYATAPIKKIVGIALVEKVLRGRKEEIWEKTNLQGGISKAEYERYLYDHRDVCAVKINSVWRLSDPVELKFKPPQSYMFLSEAKKFAITDNEIVEAWSESNIEDPINILFPGYIEIKIEE